MTVLITLTTAGVNSGSFDLYSDIDGYTTPFETGISRIALIGGYSSTLVPDTAQIIKVQSTGICLTYIFIVLENTTTTTTSTSTSSTTTTTTTAAIPACIEYTAGTYAVTGQQVTYLDCLGVFQEFYIGGVGGFDAETFCAQEGSVITTGQVAVIQNGICTTTTTTTVL